MRVVVPEMDIVIQVDRDMSFEDIDQKYSEVVVERALLTHQWKVEK